MVTAGALVYSTWYASTVMVHRRVASVAFVALVVGCSYDWNIGTGSTDTPPSSGGPSGTATSSPSPPTTDGGSSRDGGAPDTGAANGVRECGPNCECRENETCQFACTTGSCNARCTDESKCTLTCAPNTNCEMTCEDNSSCNLDCTNAQASTCNLTCKDRAQCKGTCGLGTICRRDCPRDCELTCIPGAFCTGN